MIKIMNKLEEAFERIKDFVHDEDNAGVWTTSYLLSLDEDLEVLRKLIDEKLNKPTLEEVKKEWEELGYKYEKIFAIQIVNKEKGIYIYIDDESRVYTIENKNWWGCYLNMQEHQLLNKTFRALGWLDDENR